MKRPFSSLVVAAFAMSLVAAKCNATIYGTMSNFDVYNDTPFNVYGAELELEGVHPEDVYNTFPSHFDHRSVTPYDDGTTFGTRVTFTGYNFDPVGYMAPTVGQSTNGHACVGISGCEHFGFALSAQPSATRYFWMDENGQRIGNNPMSVPTPTWNYVAPNGGGDPEVQVEIELPENEHHIQQADAVWMKVFKTQYNRPIRLKELMSGNGLVPEDVSETESEWELLERGMVADASDRIRNDNQKAIVRRYEFFKYTGPYDNEHEPSSAFDGKAITEPPAGELGDFIAANMVAANLVPDLVLAGDYNGDGSVDAADYVMWRTHKGSEVEVEIDGDHSGRVDDGDFGIWQHHFGDDIARAGGAGGAVGAGVVVPEPASLVLLPISIAMVFTGRRHRHS